MSEDVLSARQQKALGALLAGNTKQEAARAAGVNARTLARWEDAAEFRAALASGQREMLGATVRALQSLAREATGYLGAVLQDDGARPADRLRACGLVLEHVLPMIAAGDHEQRLQRLEAERDTDA